VLLASGKPKCAAYGPDTINVVASDTSRRPFSMICP
jgi:hypothetical protein